MKTLKNQIGDTIIEVLLAITIAAFAIGSAYGIASKSLQQAISARERDQALNVMESQVVALKFREQKTSLASFSAFSTPVSNFCLDETAAGPTASTWLPTSNHAVISSNTPLTVSTTTYDTKCVRNGRYYINISTKNVGGMVATVYTIAVRWERVGGGAINEASIYYRF